MKTTSRNDVEIPHSVPSVLEIYCIQYIYESYIQQLRIIESRDCADVDDPEKEIVQRGIACIDARKHMSNNGHFRLDTSVTARYKSMCKVCVARRLVRLYIDNVRLLDFQWQFEIIKNPAKINENLPKIFECSAKSTELSFG